MTRICVLLAVVLCMLCETLFAQALCETHSFDNGRYRGYIVTRDVIGRDGAIARHYDYFDAYGRYRYTRVVPPQRPRNETVLARQGPAPPIPEPLPPKRPRRPPSPERLSKLLNRENTTPERLLPPWHFGKRIELSDFYDREFDAYEGCGPVAIAIMLAAAQIEIRGGYSALLSEVDPEHDGTAPKTIAAYLESYEFRTTDYSTLTIDRVRGALDAGHVVLVVVDASGGPHWALATGYGIGQKNDVTHLQLVDNGQIGGKIELSVAEFSAMWQGSRNSAIVISPPTGQFPSTVTVPLSGPSGIDGLFPSTAAFICAALHQALGVEVHPTAYKAIVEELDPEHDGVERETLLAYLGRYFHVAEEHGTDSLLKEQLDQALPVIVSLRHNTENRSHWSLVCGYETDKHGKITAWTLLDNGWGNGRITASALSRSQQNPEINRYCITLRPDARKAIPRFPSRKPEMRMVRLDELPEKYALSLPPKKRNEYWATRAEKVAAASTISQGTAIAQGRQAGRTDTSHKRAASRDPTVERLRRSRELALKRMRDPKVKPSAEVAPAVTEDSEPEQVARNHTANYCLTVLGGISLAVLLIGFAVAHSTTPSSTPTPTQAPGAPPQGTAYLQKRS